MRAITCAAIAALCLVSTSLISGQGKARTLVAVWAHSDDEGPVGPVLARYAREGVQVHTIIVTDGSQGAGNTRLPRGPQIAKARAEEARCSTQALDPTADSARVPRRGARQLQRGPGAAVSSDAASACGAAAQPDVLITWGPDGGYGPADHRIVSSIVTQLVRAGAPGVPQRVFYASIPAEGIRAMNPGRGVPPMVIPQANLFTTRVSFTERHLDAARRSFLCQKTQVTEEPSSGWLARCARYGKVSFPSLRWCRRLPETISSSRPRPEYG